MTLEELKDWMVNSAPEGMGEDRFVVLMHGAAGHIAVAHNLDDDTEFKDVIKTYHSLFVEGKYDERT